MKIDSNRVRALGWVAPLMMLLFALPVRAQEYTLGAEDVLQISVWLHPELEKTVAIGPDGALIFAPAGEIKAAGLTARQLADRLASGSRPTCARPPR